MGILTRRGGRPIWRTLVTASTILGFTLFVRTAAGQTTPPHQSRRLPSAWSSTLPDQSQGYQIPARDSTSARASGNYWVTGALIGAGAAAVIGVIYLVAACNDCGSMGGAVVLGGTIAGGAIGGLIGSFIPKHPPPDPAASQ
jgi:hypothetical protein